MLSQL
ncbi:Putative uncharacterized protein [Lactobacillus delbrueckii subsp. lactis]